MALLLFKCYGLFGLITLLILTRMQASDPTSSLEEWTLEDWAVSLLMSIVWPITLFLAIQFLFLESSLADKIGKFLTKERRLF